LNQKSLKCDQKRLGAIEMHQGRYGKRNWRTSSSENARIKPRTTKESYRPLPGYFSLDFHPGNNRELLFLAHAGALG
jgi:hypothetical protein